MRRDSLTPTGVLYLFSWKNPGTTSYTRCKGTSATADLADGTERSHNITGRGMSPALGVGGGWYELFMNHK